MLSVVASVDEAAEAAGIDPAEAPARLEAVRAALLAARERRPQPARDDKALAAWNGMALTAFADAGRVLGRPGPRGARPRHRGVPARPAVVAGRAAAPRLARRPHPRRRLRRRLRRRHRRPARAAGARPASCAGCARRERLGALAVELFHDAGDGGFFLAPVDGEALVARTKNIEDNADAVAATRCVAGALLALARIDGDAERERIGASGLRIVRRPRGRGCRTPSAARWPCSTRYVEAPQEIAIVGAARRRRATRSSPRPPAHVLPHAVLVVADPAEPRLRRRAAAARQDGRRRRAGGVRLRAVRLPSAGDLRRGARRPARRLSARPAARRAPAPPGPPAAPRSRGCRPPGRPRPAPDPPAMAGLASAPTAQTVLSAPSAMPRPDAGALRPVGAEGVGEHPDRRLGGLDRDQHQDVRRHGQREHERHRHDAGHDGGHARHGAQPVDAVGDAARGQRGREGDQWRRP